MRFVKRILSLAMLPSGLLLSTLQETIASRIVRKPPVLSLKGSQQHGPPFGENLTEFNGAHLDENLTKLNDVTRTGPSSLAGLGHSRVSKKRKLWEWGLGFFMTVQWFDDRDVQGTIDGRSNKPTYGFRALTTKAPVSLQLNVGKYKGTIIFSQTFSTLDGSKLLLQGTSKPNPKRGDVNCCAEFPQAGAKFSSSNLLTNLLQPRAALTDVHLSMTAKFAGQEKKADWFGYLHQQNPFYPMEFSDKRVWAKSCPKGEKSKVRKVAIPLEYDSFSARRFVDEQYDPQDRSTAFLPVEELDSTSKVNVQRMAHVKRLLAYRKGMLYIKYMCHDQYILVKKVSLMMRHEVESTYVISGGAQKLDGSVAGRKQTGPTYLESP